VKILYAIDSLERGGSERSLVELVGALEPMGVEPRFFLLRGTTTGLEAQVRGMGVPIRHATATARPSRVVQLRREIEAHRPDIVHTALFESDQIGRLAALRSKAKVITSLVNTFDDPARRDDPSIRPWKLRLVSAIDGFTARHLTHHFHAVSHTVARSAVAALRVRPERVTVVERGRDPARLGTRTPDRRRRAREALAIRPDDEVILAVGRQEHQKGQRFLLEAFDQVAATRPSSLLLVAGRAGASTDALEAQRAASTAAARIRFLGERDDVPDLLAAADVFALPSLYEGLPGALIEAMALELPVVATGIEPPADPAALAASLARALEDRALTQRLVDRAHNTFLARCTLTASAEKMLALYDRVVRDAS
jgi:glycosyltransferase involved in cell wall biosynthesis